MGADSGEQAEAAAACRLAEDQGEGHAVGASAHGGKDPANPF